MRIHQMISVLKFLDEDRGLFVFRREELIPCFPNDSFEQFNGGISRMLLKGLIAKAYRNVYFNPYAKCFNESTILVLIANKLRDGHINYDIEDSEPFTVLTTGRPGLYQTPYGKIVFLHSHIRTLIKLTGKSPQECPKAYNDC